MLVLILDRSFLGPAGPWQAIFHRTGPIGSLPWGIARDRVLLKRVSTSPSGMRRVFVVGSSRAFAGFDQTLAATRLTDHVFGELAHPRLEPFDSRSLVPELIGAGADVVVFAMSEFETHRPLRFEPVSTRAAANPRAILEVFGLAGPEFAFRHRHTLYRIAVARALNAYRFREVLGNAGLDRLREFPLDRRLVVRPRVGMLTEPALGTIGFDLKRREQARLKAQLPDRLGRGSAMAWVAEIERGDHARVVMGIIRRAVEQLRSAGVAVVILEIPLHPAGLSVRGAGTRDEFIRFATSLTRDDGVRFIPLESMESFVPDDFRDLLHLNPTGATKLTRALVAALEAEHPKTPQR